MSTIDGARQRSWISDIIFTIGAEAAEVINIALQLKGEKAGEQGVNIGERVGLLAYWSDDANGDSLAAAHSAGTGIGTAGTLIEQIVDRYFTLVTNVNGAINVDATHVGAKTAHLAIILPSGQLKVSGAVTHA